MHPELIKKFELKETDMHFGATFINNVIVYQCAEDIFIAKCDTLGERRVDDMCLFWDNRNKKFMYFSESLLLGMPRHEWDRIVGINQAQQNG